MKDKYPRADYAGAHANPERLHADDIRLALSRIVNSRTFRDSYRLSSFLSFIVEMTLAGHGDKLKAYTIAVEALGRGANFDPQTDPIVRVEAGRMRQALARYYSGSGRDDPLVIEVPRGSYVPAFHRPNPCERPKPRATPAVPTIQYAEPQPPAETANRRHELAEFDPPLSRSRQSASPTGSGNEGCGWRGAADAGRVARSAAGMPAAGPCLRR